MSQSYDYVIVGGGVAGASAAQTLRAEGAKGSILLLAAEPQLPYHRGSLSKTFLSSASAESVRWILDAAGYEKLGIEVRLGAAVTSVQPSRHRLCVGAKDELVFGQLLIATGASAQQLEIPGAGLAGIHTLHSLAEAQALRASALKARRAVVIGGSFVGLEVAAALRQRGLSVTLIAHGGLLDSLALPEFSSHLLATFERHGVEVVLGDAPVRFHGQARVEGVTTSGGLTLACDLVVLGVGVTPNTQFLRGSGIELDAGRIQVDRFLQTDQPGIHAAGDVCNFFDSVFNCQRHIEHWDNAFKQGRHAARNMMGRRLPYSEVSYFYSHVFDLSFNLLGRIESTHERIDRGSLEAGSYAAIFLQDDVPQGLFSLGRPADETRMMETLIKHRVNLRSSKPQLADPEFVLDQIPNQTVYILQGGGAFGAFECGAVQALQERGIRPDIVAGVSIGAINSAIIAGNPDQAAQQLQAFWSELGTESPALADESLRRMVAGGNVAWLGVPQFFQPGWLKPFWGEDASSSRWTSLYDMSPARRLLEKYVDFERLKSSPVRLLVSAVDVETSELVVFDSYVDDLGADHILASGSLPPAFPWTTIGGRHFWDGGIVSNSPLEQVIERCGSAGKQVYIVDLYPDKAQALPANLTEVMARREEILFAERIRNDLNTETLVHDFQQLVQDMLVDLPMAAAHRIRHQPNFIQLMGQQAPLQITRIVRESVPGEPAASGYDFSGQTLARLIEAGYRMALRAIDARPLPVGSAWPADASLGLGDKGWLSA